MPRLLLAFACIASLSALTADEIRDEFLRVADGLKNSSTSFLGERQIESLGGYFESSRISPPVIEQKRAPFWAAISSDLGGLQKRKRSLMPRFQK